MKSKSQTDEFSFAAIFAGGLLKAIGWTIVYYVGAWASLLGLGLVAKFIMDRKDRKTKK